MSRLIKPFFLPVSRTNAESFFAYDAVPEQPIERAALLAGMVLSQADQSLARRFNLIQEALDLFKAYPSSGGQQLLDMRSRSPHRSFKLFEQALSGRDTTFAPEAFLADGSWSDPEGKYTDNFQLVCQKVMTEYEVFAAPSVSARDLNDPDGAPLHRAGFGKRFTGTRDQEICTRAIIANEGEHFRIHGYAGTGKSHLVHAIGGAIDRVYTYCAPSQQHIYGFLRHAGAAVSSLRTITQWQLAHEMAKITARETAAPWVPHVVRSTMNLEEQARAGEVLPIGPHAPEVVLHRVMDGIRAWCNTTDRRIEASHFRRAIPYGTAGLPQYIAAAEHVWARMFARRKIDVFPVSINHIAKWLSLHDAPVPSQYGTLLVDEAHDLSAAWIRVLDRYGGGLILMGDPHQNLRTAAKGSHTSKVMQMSRSVRIGIGAERLIESTLQLASERYIEDTFEGSPDHATRRRFYRSPSEVPDAGMHLFGSEWALLLAAQRLCASGASYAFLPTSANLLRTAVVNAKNLAKFGDTFRGVTVSGFRQWEQLAAHLTRSGLSAVVAQIEGDLTVDEVDKLVASQDAGAHPTVIIGLMDHAKNIESSRVVLAPCCFGDAARQRKFQPVNGVYLAMTRAVDELYVPGDCLDQLRDLNQSLSRA